MGYWKGQMERCIACHACRGACPMCVCRDYCVSDTRDPAWVTQEDTVQQKLFFQLITPSTSPGAARAAPNANAPAPWTFPCSRSSSSLAA